LKEQGESRPVLLVCPTSVVNNWKKEAEKFTPNLKILVHHGADRKKKDAFQKAAERNELVLSSYGLLARDADFLQNVQWSGLVLDEAQNIKNHETRRARASRSIKAGYRIALTGTPVENHVGDLWSIMDFLNPGFLGGHSAFINRFYKPIQLWNNEQAATRLKRLTSPFILRRLKTDKTVISDLPEKIEATEHCTLTREQVTLYKAVLKEMEEHIQGSEGLKRKGMILATLTRLKQICNHPSQFSGDAEHTSKRSGKLVRLLEMLDQIRQSGESSLIFTQYAEMGSILKNCLREELMEDAFFLSGQTTRKKRDEMIRIFQEAPNAPGVFILSLKAGGTGLNLSRANHVFHYDRWWNPAVENQATDRAFRIGQKKNVQVHKFVVAGSLEERIAQMIESKSALADRVIGKGEAGLTELSDRDIKELLKLGREAEGD
ncbi:MAG TPA: DEAD/DEAH box helicase, partial [Synergistetes bacterium]|nr:DEAD/DEAH box helicase [Synergistota bacterium]